MDIQALERVDRLDRASFQADFYQPQRPVVFSSFSEDWPARKLWDYDYMKKMAGDVPVNVFGNWANNHPTKISRTPMAKMTFAEYLQHIEQGPSEYRLFLFNLFRHKPELRRDFSFPDIIDHWVTSQPMLFFGGQGSDVRLHYDLDLSNVFLTQFSGEKKVILFTPDQSEALYHQPFSSHSNVDLTSLDYARFPAIRQTHGLECTLRHGDTLFIPSGFWHYIYYTSSGFSMALRALPAPWQQKFHALYNITVMKTVDDVLSRLADEPWSRYKLNRAKVLAEKRFDSQAC